MTQFFTWLALFLIFTGLTTICGYKAKESWDKWHNKPTVTNSPSVLNQQNVGILNGDAIIGNKTVIENQVINTEGVVSVDSQSKIDVAKLRIKRAFEDFDKSLKEIVANFPKESERIAAQFNSRGTLSSGMHIKAQMDFSIGIKKKLDQEYEVLKRDIEDILIEVLNKTSLQSARSEFSEEQKRLDDAENRCKAIYPQLNDLPKSWEVRIFNESRLTKDFTVADK